MANRSFSDKNYTLIKREVKLYAAVSVGAAGAVTLKKWVYPTLGKGPNARTYVAAPLATTLPTGNATLATQYTAGAEGIRSVVRNAAGKWTIKLQDNYQRVLGVSFVAENATGASTVVAVGKGPSTSMGAVGGSEFFIQFSSATATAADPANGDTILLSISLADSTEQ